MRRNKNSYMLLIIVLMIGITIGYAALNSTLNITGKSNISKNTWDVYFDNLYVTSTSVDGVGDPIILDDTTINFEVILNIPGEKYEFYVDVINEGSIDAMVESLVKMPELTSTQDLYFNYTIEYQNGEQIQPNQLVEKNSFVRLKVKVEYDSNVDPNDLPTEAETLNLGFRLNYIQSDDNSISIADNGVSYDIGIEKCIGSECFHIIGTEGENVKLFSIYNLYVGGEYNRETGHLRLYGEEATGMQDENMRGYVKGETLAKGTISFSNVSNVYSGSIVEEYVNNYKTKLEEYYEIEVLEARLISSDELKEFGCNYVNKLCFTDREYTWIYSTSYWTGTGKGTSKYNWVVYVRTIGDNYYAQSIAKTTFGVRPVIIVSKDIFE